LGHALGLDHSTSTDVMDAAITGHTSTQALSQNDKDSYDAAYNNY
jgi:matrixin